MAECDGERLAFCRARTASDLGVLEELTTSGNGKIALKSVIELYRQGAVDLGTVLGKMRECPYDGPTVKLVSFERDRGNADAAFRLLHDAAIWTDLIIYLEQMALLLRAPKVEIGHVRRVRLHKQAELAAKEDRHVCIQADHERRKIADYLLGYIALKADRYPTRRYDLAHRTASSRPSIPYPEEHAELLQYLGSKGYEHLEGLGYDPALHGTVPVQMRLDYSGGDFYALSSDRPSIAFVGELLAAGYTIDFDSGAVQKKAPGTRSK